MIRTGTVAWPVWKRSFWTPSRRRAETDSGERSFQVPVWKYVESKTWLISSAVWSTLRPWFIYLCILITTGSAFVVSTGGLTTTAVGSSTTGSSFTASGGGSFTTGSGSAVCAGGSSTTWSTGSASIAQPPLAWPPRDQLGAWPSRGPTRDSTTTVAASTTRTGVFAAWKVHVGDKYFYKYIYFSTVSTVFLYYWCTKRRRAAFFIYLHKFTINTGVLFTRLCSLFARLQ